MQLKAKPLRWLALGTALILPASAVAGIKCWTDKDGVRACGNFVPPEYSQQQSVTIDNSGVTVNTQNRAKTKEELANEAAEEKRQAEEKAQKEKQAAADHVLLQTFTSEQDVIDSRDRKLSALDASIGITHAAIDSLKNKLSQLQKRAASAERNGRPISDDLKSDMDGINKQIADKQAYIASVEKEKDGIKAKYDGYIKRYRELTATKPQ